MSEGLWLESCFSEKTSIIFAAMFPESSGRILRYFRWSSFSNDCRWSSHPSKYQAADDKDGL